VTIDRKGHEAASLRVAKQSNFITTASDGETA
jgi:hypothetical protein